MAKENTERVYAFITPTDKATLQAQAEREGSNLSTILRRLTREYADKLRENENSNIPDRITNGVDSVAVRLIEENIKNSKESLKELANR